jgi:hypothetical protein
MTLNEAIRERNETLPPRETLFEHGTRPQFRIGVYGRHPSSDAYFDSEVDAIAFVLSYDPEQHNDRRLNP